VIGRLVEFESGSESQTKESQTKLQSIENGTIKEHFKKLEALLLHRDNLSASEAAGTSATLLLLRFIELLDKGFGKGRGRRRILTGNLAASRLAHVKRTIRIALGNSKTHQLTVLFNVTPHRNHRRPEKRTMLLQLALNVQLEFVEPFELVDGFFHVGVWVERSQTKQTNRIVFWLPTSSHLVSRVLERRSVVVGIRQREERDRTVADGSSGFHGAVEVTQDTAEVGVVVEVCERCKVSLLNPQFALIRKSHLPSERVHRE